MFIYKFVYYDKCVVAEEEHGFDVTGGHDGMMFTEGHTPLHTRVKGYYELHR